MSLSASHLYLREWQKKAIASSLNRVKKTEVTSAYQGSGKTVYAAAYYVVSQLKDPSILNLNFLEIAEKYKQSTQKIKNFCIVFIPAHSIRQSTIKAWESLGVKLAYMTNSQLKKTSLSELIWDGYDGLVCTYHQANYWGYNCNGIWHGSPLIDLIVESDKTIKIHATLDECHEVSLNNLKSKFFLDNQALFNQIHLMSGTIVNFSLGDLTTGKLGKIPFVNYNKDTGEAIPDTVYSQEDAIRDKVIVKTKIVSHPVVKASVNIDGKDYKIDEADLDWFFSNFSEAAFKFSDHENHERLHEIDEAFKVIYQSKDVWQNLLIYGNDWLKNVRKNYTDAKGIIFAPSKKAAELIHSQLLPNNSVLCVAKGTNAESLQRLKYVYSNDISRWLEQNDSEIDWIVSCETLKQGFDYPKCKVQILVPRLHYLNLVKVSQMLGRTNRSILGYPNLEAVCLTIDHKAIVELLNYSQDSNFGICYKSDILDCYTEQINYETIQRIEAAESGLLIPAKVTKITELFMSSSAKVLTSSGYELFTYGVRVTKELDASHIKTYWTHWGSLVKRNRDFPDPELNLPPEDSGVYTIINSTSLEVLYIGESNNLLKRISDKTRYFKTEWLPTEGADNLFVRWVVTAKGHKELERKLIREVNPKYNKTMYEDSRTA